MKTTKRPKLSDVELVDRIDELEQLLTDIYHAARFKSSRRRQQNVLDAIRSAVKWQIPDVARREVSDPTWLERILDN